MCIENPHYQCIPVIIKRSWSTNAWLLPQCCQVVRSQASQAVSWARYSNFLILCWYHIPSQLYSPCLWDTDSCLCVTEPLGLCIWCSFHLNSLSFHLGTWKSYIPSGTTQLSLWTRISFTAGFSFIVDYLPAELPGKPLWNCWSFIYSSRTVFSLPFNY